MRKKTIALVAASVMALSVAWAPAAHAGGCVSKKEYKKIHNGMKRRRVHRIFDTAGKQSSHFSMGGDVYEGRQYKACSSSYGVHGIVWVDYENFKVDSKMASW